MESMMAYGGNNLMNMVLHKVYAAQRNRFKGSGNSSGLAYTYDVTDVPVARLVANSTSHNLEIELKTAITAKGGIINFAGNLPMKATGKLAISQGRLSLTGIKIVPTTTNAIDRAVISLINSTIVPMISTTLSAIPIPQLTNVFGTGLSASIQTAKVIAGPALEVGARIAGRTGIAAADAPSNLASLNNGNATNAQLIALVSGAAANELVKAATPALLHNFDKRGSGAGFGAGIKGTIKSSIPVLEVKNGSGNASTTISFTGLKGGIRIPIKGWTWLALPAPNVKVVITHALMSSGNTGIIKLTGVSAISVSFSWPTILKPVEAVLKTLLNGILTLFRGMISNAVSGKKFELFKLPSTIPGTNLGATLSFTAGGLSYFKSSIQAIVQIRG